MRRWACPEYALGGEKSMYSSEVFLYALYLYLYYVVALVLVELYSSHLSTEQVTQPELLSISIFIC